MTPTDVLTDGLCLDSRMEDPSIRSKLQLDEIERKAQVVAPKLEKRVSRSFPLSMLTSVEGKSQFSQKMLFTPRLTSIIIVQCIDAR